MSGRNKNNTVTDSIDHFITEHMEIDENYLTYSRIAELLLATKKLSFP